MKIKSLNTTVAYRCPECGDLVFGKAGLFTLSGDMLKLKCGCEHGSELILKRDRSGLTEAQALCPLCGEKHAWSFREDAEFSSPAISCSCPVSNMNVLYVGEQNAISEIAETDGRMMMEVLEENGFATLAEFLAARRVQRENAAKRPDTGKYSPEELASMISSVLSELQEDGMILCDCGEGEQELTLSLENDGLHIDCLSCGRHTVLPPETVFNPDVLARLDKIELN